MKPKPSLIPRFNKDYSFNDFCYGIKSIFTNTDFDLNTLEAILDNKNFFFTNSGRTSLYVILKALNLPKGSKVGVPLYSCTVVFDAILKAGHVPCFIDICLDNYTLDTQDLEDKIESLSAIVVIHTFGRPADMDKINKIAKSIPVIEDCAHSLLSEYKGKKTGTMGTASFFSLAKYISAGGGGMIILNDDELKENIQIEIARLNNLSRLNGIRHSLFTYVYSFLYHKPWYGLFAFSIGSYIENKVDFVGNKGFKSAKKIRKSDLGVFLKKLEVFREKVEVQRKNSQILLNELECTSLVLPYEWWDTYCNCFLFPLRFTDKRGRDLASNFLTNEGIDTSTLYSETPSQAKQYYGYTGDCPNTDEFVERVLIIPNYYSLTSEELINIITAIKKIGELT